MFAQSRCAMDIIFHGWSIRVFQGIATVIDDVVEGFEDAVR
jgi:hypothetical protein